MIPKINTTLDAVSAVLDVWRGAKSKSLIQYTSPTRVEPEVLIENSLRNQDYMKDLCITLNNIFSGYYLQAVAIHTNVGSVDVVKMLDKLSTERSPSDEIARRATMSLAAESYREALPDYNNISLSMQARDDMARKQSFGNKTVETAYDATELSVGKLLEVKITDGANEATIPVSVRLMVKTMRDSSVVAVLSNSGKDRSVVTRVHEFKSGAKQFWRDLVMCQDIIDDHRKTLRADDSGSIAATMKKRQQNRLAALISLEPSLNNMSTIAVISKSTARKVEREIRGKLSRTKSREDLMSALGLMLLVVVDTEYEVVTIYHNGIDGETELTTKELAKSKTKEADIGDVLKTYQAARAPSF